MGSSRRQAAVPTNHKGHDLKGGGMFYHRPTKSELLTSVRYSPAFHSIQRRHLLSQMFIYPPGYFQTQEASLPKSLNQNRE